MKKAGKMGEAPHARQDGIQVALHVIEKGACGLETKLGRA